MSCRDNIRKTKDNTLLVFDKSYFYLKKEKLMILLTKFWLINKRGLADSLGRRFPDF